MTVAALFRRARWCAALGALVLLASGCLLEPIPVPVPGLTATACDAYASPTGSDANAGTEASPVLTPRTLASLLAPGEVGCFTAGDYTIPTGGWGVIVDGGAAGSPITLTAAPGAVVNITGPWELTSSAAHIVISRLNLLGTGVLGPNLMNINADDAEISQNNISNPGGICLYAGSWDAYAGTENGIRTDDLVIADNRIHDCGTDPGLDHTNPATSGWHGVYLSNTLNTTVTRNLIYGNKWRGIQTWPRAVDVVISNNVIDGNATNVNLGSEDPWYSTNVTVRDNIISNATFFRPDKNSAQVHGNFPNDGDTHGNQVTSNCLWNPGAYPDFSGYGYTETGNHTGDPMFVDAASGDFRLQIGSGCEGDGPSYVQPPEADWEGNECTIVGSAGPDVLYGTAGDDVICGLGGDDVILPSMGFDRIDGGDGKDMVSFQDLTYPVVVNLYNEDVYVDGQPLYHLLHSIEDAEGGPDGDILIGSDGPNELYGLEGNDSLYGYGDDDLLDGGGSFDTCVPGTGTDTLINCEA